MPLDGSTFEGGPQRNPWCRACKQTIHNHQRATRVEFRTDPNGADGLTGDYHLECSKPYASLAYVINLNPWGGR